MEKVHIGYFDSEETTPSHDDAWLCPVCHGPIDNSREYVSILIHCTRWPLCTFLRLHKDEISVLGEVRYHEIIVEALLERDRIEQERTAVPELFREAFNL